MRHLLEIARTGLTSVLLHPLRSVVTIVCLVAALLPFLVGLGLAHGLRAEAQAAVRYGADLYVTGEQFGRNVPLPLESAEAIRKVPGVEAVVPRIVGDLELGVEKISAVLIGLPLEDFPQELSCIDGRLYDNSNRNELVVGSDLARRLKLSVGSLLPPFYKSRQGEHVSEVVGLFRSELSLEQARLIVTSFQTAERIFDQSGLATDLLVHCRPGYEEEVRRTILREMSWQQGAIRPRIVTREDRAATLPESILRREGVFTLHFVVVFIVAILVVLVTSGVGLPERRREVGILKALGWQTDELLLRGLVESGLLSLAGASLAVVLAVGWLEGLNGYWIAGVFLPDAGLLPGFRVPFRLVPVPVLLTVLIAFVVVLSGSLWSTWRAAIAAPREVMR